MRKHQIKAQIGYKRRYIKGSKTAKVAANLLNRNFSPDAATVSWVSDITYVRTYEGFLYVATVLDLFLGALLVGLWVKISTVTW